MANSEEARPSALILAGGGLDSSACIHQFLAAGIDVRALHIDFGQVAAVREWDAVQKIGKHFKVRTDQIHVQGPVGFPGGKILGRNALFVFLATVYREVHEHIICLGVHAGTDFFDCSPPFVETANSMVSALTDGQAKLVAPLLELKKVDIVDYLRRNSFPLELTYSCQLGGNNPCGECLSCADRRRLGC